MKPMGVNKPFAKLLRSLKEAVVVYDGKKFMEYVNPAFKNLAANLGEQAARKALSLAGCGATESHRAGTNRGSERLLRATDPRAGAEFPALTRKLRRRKTRRLRRQVIEGLAHDIKNPLTIASVHAQLLAAQLGADDDCAQNRHLVQGIQDNIKRIERLVESFLDMAAIKKGMAALRKPVALNHLIREVAQQHIQVLHAKQTSLQLKLDEGRPEIMGHESQLERVLWNLLGNAAKFTSAGGAITLASGCIDDQACIEVEDTGTGIPEDELRVIFNEFERGRSADHVSGAGLGLFIVKTIVESHGGAVHVESKAGQGTKFVLRFPAGGSSLSLRR